MSSKDAEILVQLQKLTHKVPGILQISKALNLFGEHAAGWLTLGLGGVVLDKKRRRQWAGLFTAALLSHAASVVIKRIVRRHRPTDERVIVGAETPSKFSFPSSHATSSTAALIYLARITHSPLPLLGIPAMMLSRLVVGVHYPTDVVTGALLGAATAEAVEKFERATR